MNTSPDDERPADPTPPATKVPALQFAAHRQLARWAHEDELSPRQRAKRATLVSAVRILENEGFADGCELHALSQE